MSQARGLTVFISDLRNCTNPDQERKRVEKEMHREWNIKQNQSLKRSKSRVQGVECILLCPAASTCIALNFSLFIAADIRSKFTSEASMSGYNRKKYVW